MRDSHELKVKYLLNSAVLVEYGAKKLLVDGIISDRQNFDMMDGRLEHDLMNGDGEFKGLSCVLFTHCHGDHFSNSNTRRFLEKNRGIDLFIPSNGGISEDFIRSKGSQGYIIRGEEGEILTFQFDDMTIEYMKVDHLTFDYPEHYCINIVGPDENIIFTADMDFNKMELLKKFTMKAHSSIFVNHLAMLHRKWRNSLIDLGCDDIYFYHLPSQYVDGFGYRDRALRNWEKYKDLFPGARLLTYEPK